MKFLLDENVHRGLFSFLIKLGYEVKLSPKAIKNGEVFRLAVNEKRTLISRDSDFLEFPVYSSSEHFGIVLLRISPNDLKMQKEAVSKLLKKYSDLKGMVVILKSEEDMEYVK